jgi:hypothetical protein
MTLLIKDSNNNVNPASEPTLLAFVETGSQHLANWPVAFGSVQHPCLPQRWDKQCLYNSDLTLAAKSIAHFNWAVYGFNSGHFISSIWSLSLPFNITLLADPFINGRSLFTEFSTTPSPILSGASALLYHVQSSVITSILLGYLIHSHRYLTTKPTSHFWEIQASIVTQLRLTQSLSIVMAFVHPEHDSRAVTLNFVNWLRKDGWIITNTSIAYSDFGDSVCGGCRFIVAIHHNTEASCPPFKVVALPHCMPNPLSTYMWAPFNQPESALSYLPHDPSFNNHTFNGSGLPPLSVSPCSKANKLLAGNGVKLMYHLHRIDANPSLLVGAAVIGTDGLCPCFDPCDNQNLFCYHFEINFSPDGHSYIRAISPFKFS